MWQFNRYQIFYQKAMAMKDILALFSCINFCAIWFCEQNLFVLWNRLDQIQLIWMNLREWFWKLLMILMMESVITLQWRHNGRDSVSNHQLRGCLLNRLFSRRSKKTAKLRVTGLCAGNSPVTGEFPAQRASNAGSVSIWWRHHELFSYWYRNILTKLVQ